MSRFDNVNYGGTPTTELQESLKSTFRQGELQRREARMKIMINHESLSSERMSEEDIRIDKEAKIRIRDQHRALEKAMYDGYWSRLWAAIRGK
jgi:hypothetical protein